MTSAITVSIGGISYAALNPRELESRAQTVADQATCRTVDTAIVGYLMNNGEEPTAISQLDSYVRGDISKYRIVNGIADGPGCADLR
ncbi:hypothetical protein SAMN04489716_3633 [Actinoplanes derwentensis]|uniref:Uncharacterized protein n=2 Tax=Actinoplanes derwentensis TaxID=113562 RepID=A0A1H2A2L8_9ACTN|nr:hypothetical protein Ade03nite_23310 [Actinoplanes derwentensis]SDT40221.1 hypothetical protein SAMN04489716_3633 [Actinoplanes derwentensis]